MTRPERGRSRAVLFCAILAALQVPVNGYAGEGAGETAQPTNRRAAEHAITEALESSGIPEGSGAAVTARIEESDGARGEILGMLAVEFLIRRGYRVLPGDALPGFVFRADTLAVTLERKGSFRKAEAVRFAEAAVGAVFRPDERTRMVYRGRGAYRDSLPVWAAVPDGREKEFVIDRSRRFAAVRPIFLGLVVTGLVWLLYSYRG